MSGYHYLHMWGFCIVFNGASAALRTTKRSHIPIEETKGNPWIDFLMIVMVRGIARGRARSDGGDGDDGGVAKDVGHPPNNSLTETCSLGLPCLFYDIMLWQLDTCHIKSFANQYHVIISQAKVYSSSRSRVLLKVTADQVLVFDWMASSCQVNVLKTELGCSEAC